MPSLNSPKLKIGTVREDGFVFRGYDKRRSGKREHWISPAAAAKRKLTTARLTRAAWERIKADPAKLAAFNARQARYARESRRSKPVQHMLARARVRAAVKGVPFSITALDVIIPAVCPALGIRLAVQDGMATDSSPELDRVIPSLGYVPGNVEVISRRANRIKSDAAVSELEKIVSYLKRRK